MGKEGIKLRVYTPELVRKGDSERDLYLDFRDDGTVEFSPDVVGVLNISVYWGVLFHQDQDDVTSWYLEVRPYRAGLSNIFPVRVRQDDVVFVETSGWFFAVVADSLGLHGESLSGIRMSFLEDPVIHDGRKLYRLDA